MPDFIPIAGQLDDAIIAALVLRGALRSAGPYLLRQHWPGPPASLAALTRLCQQRATASVNVDEAPPANKPSELA